MSDSDSPPVFMFDNSDPGMQRAYESARASFRYFWREIAWDRRRIASALELACVKAPFTDGPKVDDAETPEVEHMWLSDVDFDGKFVSGVLVNSPNWLTTVHEGDNVRIITGQISDWMYAINGEVYGAFTVNLMRSRMSNQEREDHDAAWGLDFGDPFQVRMPAETDEMGENLVYSLREHLAGNPSAISETGHNGWTLLHQDASSGSAATVEVLLEFGADPNAKADNGMTPLQLAEVLGWDSVIALLTR